MSQHTENAVNLASKLATGVVSPRMADAVAKTIVYCSLHATPLTDDQCEQLYRACFEASDGTQQQLLDEIETHQGLEILRSLQPAPRRGTTGGAPT